MQCNHRKIANEYDQRNADAIVQLERNIQDMIPFVGIKQDGRLLDYACGTGMLSRVSGSVQGGKCDYVKSKLTLYL